MRRVHVQQLCAATAWSAGSPGLSACQSRCVTAPAAHVTPRNIAGLSRGGRPRPGTRSRRVSVPDRRCRGRTASSPGRRRRAGLGSAAGRGPSAATQMTRRYISRSARASARGPEAPRRTSRAHTESAHRWAIAWVSRPAAWSPGCTPGRDRWRRRTWRGRGRSK